MAALVHESLQGSAETLARCTSRQYSGALGKIVHRSTKPAQEPACALPSLPFAVSPRCNRDGVRSGTSPAETIRMNTMGEAE